jgi:hypothetical protein
VITAVLPLLLLVSGAFGGDSSRVVAQPQYAFCHDPQYPLSEREAQWCPLLEAERARLEDTCPGFVQACSAPRAVLSGSGRLSTRMGASSDGDGDGDPARGDGDGPERGSAPTPPEPESVELPALGGLAQVLFWGVLIAAAVMIVVAVLRNRSIREPVLEESGPEGDHGVDEAEQAAATRAMETDVERLLALARRSGDRGAFEEAVDYAHAALLRRLDHEGLIRLHASRTNGEYVRELLDMRDIQDKGPSVEDVRGVLQEVDRAQFGPEPPGSSVFEAIFGRVRTLVKTVGPLVMLLATVLGTSCDEGQDTSYPWSTSPSGTQGVLTFLRDEGVEVSYRTASLTELEGEWEPGMPQTIVLLPDAGVTAEEWSALRTWVRGGGTLMIAGGVLPSWFRSASYAPTPPGESFLPYAPAQRSIEIDDRYALSSRNWFDPYDDLELLDAQNPYSAWFDEGAGNVVVFADDWLFTNAALVFSENGGALLYELDGRRVELVDSLVARGADTPAESIRNTHLTAALVQLLLLILALYLWRGTRFGKGRDPVPVGRQAFVRHARAMGRQYEKAGAASYAGRLYAAWALERLRAQFSRAAASGLLGLSQEVARRTGRDETEVMRLLVAAHSATEGVPGKGGSPDDLTLIRDLGRLMSQTRNTRGRAAPRNGDDP